MAISPAKENILKKIRKALSNPVPLPFPNSEGAHSVYHAATEELEVIFAEEFIKLQGKFAYCATEAELIQQIQLLIAEQKWEKIFCKETKWNNHFSNTTDLPGCDAAITACEYLVARTGSIVMSTAQESGRTVSVYAPVHICIAYVSQLVYDIKDGLQLIKEKYANKMPSLITFATGPSRTADIEKTLVTGVHGPKEVYLFLVEHIF
ncbi:MAG: LUD domain-containing protein [Chitinophagaceae bacterium]|nr:LUD domain-containing protein [Chitinophagaceae bacterium]